MSPRTLPTSTAVDFAAVASQVRTAGLRPEVKVTEVPAPQRIAPHAVALTADILPRATDDTELATGRFVLLHDPDEPSAWDGAWRVVTFARAELEPELAGDPLLGDVGWSWLIDALQGRGLRYAAEAGTVTRVVSQSYAGLDDRETTVELEVRASWTPSADEIPEHLVAWTDLLSTIAGLPPLPEGVVPLSGPRR